MELYNKLVAIITGWLDKLDASTLSSAGGFTAFGLLAPTLESLTSSDLGWPRRQWYHDGHRRCRRTDRQFSGPPRETRFGAGLVSGTAVDSEDTLLFSQLNNIASTNEIFPLEEAQAAYDRMMSGKARFRAVLKIDS